MKKTRIVIIGDSHTRAMSNAMQLTSGKHPNVSFEVHWLARETGDTGVVRGDMTMEQASDLLSKLDSQDVVMLSLLGTAHNILGLLRHERPFWVLPKTAKSEAEIVPGSELIPWVVLREMFEEVGGRNKRLTQIRDMSPARTFHTMTPPPKEDNKFLQSKIDSYRGKLASEYGISPPAIRLRLWEAEREALRALCGQWRIGFLDVPASARDERGFLKREFYADDATHANAAYGELVLNELADECVERGAPAKPRKAKRND
jgi:hypothetical protein